MIEGTHRLAGARSAAAAIAMAEIEQLVTVEVDNVSKTSGLRFVDHAGQLLGTLTARHEVARRIVAGERILHCSVNSTSAPSDDRPHGSVNVRIVTGAIGEVYERPPPVTYPVGLVGESFHQEAIRQCRVGDIITLWHETGNPHDVLAIVAKRASGETIGHLARDSWLRAAIHNEGSGVRATVKAINIGRALGVVLDIELGAFPLGSTAYRAVEVTRRPHPHSTLPEQTPPSRRRGWLARLLGW